MVPQKSFNPVEFKDCNIRTFKVIAYAYAGRTLIAKSTNRKGSGFVSPFSWHAEELLVRKLRRIRAIERLGPIRVHVARFTKQGHARIAKPCPGCFELLSRYGIKEITYTVSS